MQKMIRNFVSISLALALCGGISGMAFAQEADEEAPAPTVWSAPSISTGTGTFNIGIQTVFNGFLVTSDVKPDPDGDYPDTTIDEENYEDYSAVISVSATYDNSDAPGVGYSFGVSGGVRKVDIDSTGPTVYFDNPWGKFFFLNKQLWLRSGGPEDPWTAWSDAWSYGDDFDNAVQLNINPSALSGLNLGVTLPFNLDAVKADYPLNNMVAGFKLGEPLPYTTISAALKLREGRYSEVITAHPDLEKKLKDLNKSMDLNAALTFSLSPVSFYLQMQFADLGEDVEGVPLTVETKDLDDVSRDVNVQINPYLELSLSSLVDLGAFSLETLTAEAWIKSDPMYVSDGDSNTELEFTWAPSYTLFSNGANSIKASLLFDVTVNLWGGDPTMAEQTLKDNYAYNQVGFQLRPAVQFNFGPNSAIRLRDAIYFMQTGVDPERGIKNQVQVKFWWGF